MAIKDKAKELSEMYFFEARTNSYCRQATQQACEMMAYWVVNEACEYLETHLPEYWQQLNANNVSEFINNFKMQWNED